MPEIFFHPEVSQEIRSAYDWYQSKAEGLGDDFLDELEYSYQTIVELPVIWPHFSKGFRRFLLTRFPFAVIYREKRSDIFVVAVMHQSRKPGYWQDRI